MANFITYAPACASRAIDWNGDGLLDIVTNEYIGPALDHLPEHRQKRRGRTADPGEVGEIETRAGTYPCFRFVDFHGDGRRDLVVSFLKDDYKVNSNDPLWFKATDEEKKKAQWPRWYYKYVIDYYENLAGPGQPPKYGPPVRLKTIDGAEIGWYIAPCFEFLDWDGDGKLELLVSRNSPVMEKGYAGIEMYKNVGTASAPVFEDRGLVPGLRDDLWFGFAKRTRPPSRGCWSRWAA